MKHEFILEGLHCANCAAKIETKLDKTYDEVLFSFATLELEIHSDKEDIRNEVQAIVDSIEDGVTVVPKSEHEHHEHHDHHHECHDGCCGHEHEHDHDHHHHDHEQEHHHDHGHEHHHESGESKVKLILLIIAAVFFVAAFILHILGKFDLICNILSICSAILAGYDVVIEGVKSVFKRRIDETTLMTVAVIAAMVLGEFVEGAAVMVLFGIGELLEDKAVEKSRRDIRKLADIRPDTAYLYENGKSREIRAEDVKIGTILEIPPHTRVPLDGVITEGSTTLDTSSLTGESAPMDASVGTELLSGMMNNDSAVYMRTTKAYRQDGRGKLQEQGQPREAHYPLCGGLHPRHDRLSGVDRRHPLPHHRRLGRLDPQSARLSCRVMPLLHRHFRTPFLLCGNRSGEQGRRADQRRKICRSAGKHQGLCL